MAGVFYNEHKFSWRDIVLVNGEFHEEEFPISGEMDAPDIYRIDEFLSAVADKYGVYADDVQTYLMDGIEYPAKQFPGAIYRIGLYIDGKEC